MFSGAQALFHRRTSDTVLKLEPLFKPRNIFRIFICYWNIVPRYFASMHHQPYEWSRFLQDDEEPKDIQEVLGQESFFFGLWVLGVCVILTQRLLNQDSDSESSECVTEHFISRVNNEPLEPVSRRSISLQPQE